MTQRSSSPAYIISKHEQIFRENMGYFFELSDDVLQSTCSILSRLYKSSKVCILLDDSFRGWLYDRLGFQGPNRSSLFAHTLNSAAPRVVTISDLSMDFRFHSDPLSQNAGFRSYTGISLVVEGVKIGVLALFDCAVLSASNAITKSQELLLTEFADTVAGILSDRWIDQTEAAVSSVRIHQGVLGVLQEPLHKLNSVVSNIDCHIRKQSFNDVALRYELECLRTQEGFIQRIIELALQLIAVEQVHAPCLPRHQRRAFVSQTSIPALWSNPTPFKFHLERWVWTMHKMLAESGLLTAANGVTVRNTVDDMMATEQFYWLDSHPTLLLLCVASLAGHLCHQFSSEAVVESPLRIEVGFLTDDNCLQFNIQIISSMGAINLSNLPKSVLSSVDILLQFLNGSISASSAFAIELSVPLRLQFQMNRKPFSPARSLKFQTSCFLKPQEKSEDISLTHCVETVTPIPSSSPFESVDNCAHHDMTSAFSMSSPKRPMRAVATMIGHALRRFCDFLPKSTSIHSSRQRLITVHPISTSPSTDPPDCPSFKPLFPFSSVPSSNSSSPTRKHSQVAPILLPGNPTSCAGHSHQTAGKDTDFKTSMARPASIIIPSATASASSTRTAFLTYGNHHTTASSPMMSISSTSTTMMTTSWWSSSLSPSTATSPRSVHVTSVQPTM